MREVCVRLTFANALSKELPFVLLFRFVVDVEIFIFF